MYRKFGVNLEEINCGRPAGPAGFVSLIHAIRNIAYVYLCIYHRIQNTARIH